MKIRANRRFPYNYIWGIFLYKEYEFKLPQKRADIMRKKRDSDFQAKVDGFYSSFSHKEEIPENYERLAVALGVTMQIRTESNNIVKYGSGKNFAYFLSDIII